jgi:hypothetical protein
VILDANGNIFVGFTPVEWESIAFSTHKADPSLKSFLFTLRNPHNFPPRRFALNPEKKDESICCDSKSGPHFSDLIVSGNLSTNTDNDTSSFGNTYINDTGLDEGILFTGAPKFKVKEIEVFEISPPSSEIGSLKLLAVPARRLESRAFWDFPAIFEDFKTQRFTLLWRGSRDGFDLSDFHSRCDGHTNTLTVILDREGNIFGGFTPVELESREIATGENSFKGDPSMKSFLFTLEHPHNMGWRRFAFKAERKDWAICCESHQGPNFYDIAVFIRDAVTGMMLSWASYFGSNYTNDPGLRGRRFSRNHRMSREGNRSIRNQPLNNLPTQ